MDRNKLRRIVRESIRSVILENSAMGACPSEQEWQSLVGIAQSMFMGRSFRGEPPTGFLKAWNRYADRGMNIPKMYYDYVPECARAVVRVGQRTYKMSSADYQQICDAWMEDAQQGW